MIRRGLCSRAKPLDLFVVDKPVLAAHAVMDGMEPFAGHVRRGTMRQVPAGVDPHAEDGIAGLEDRKKDALIGLAAGVGLHIREVAAEHLFRAIDGKFLGDVDNVAAAVIALSGIAFRVFVGEHRSGRFKHRARYVIFRGDELDFILLAKKLALEDAENLGIGLPKRRGKEFAS